MNNGDTVSYMVTINYRFTQTLFPNTYPNSAHFSPIIGWSHNNISDIFEKHKIDNPDYKCNDPTNSASGNCRFKNGKRFGWIAQHSKPSSVNNYCKDHNNNILKNAFCSVRTSA